MNRTLSAFAVCGLLLTALCGCRNNIDISDNTAFTRDLFAMDTFMSVRAYGKNASAALNSSEKLISSLEKELSVTLPESDISRINSSGEPVRVSGNTAAIIDAAVRYGSLTDGALDITLYPVLRAWGFTTGEYRIPDSHELSELLEKVDYRQIQSEDSTVSVPENVMIDLGALAKGYTSDAVAQIMREKGVSSGLINLGGNVQTVGTKPDGSLWRVAVRNPYSPDTDMCVVEIADKAVITSGTYERYFTGEDGKNYWHILDPSTGCPADNGVVSATIIGESGIMCDALSTALFVAGTEKAVSYWQSGNEDFDMILVTNDRRMICTDGISDAFSSSCSMPVEVIHRA